MLDTHTVEESPSEAMRALDRLAARPFQLRGSMTDLRWIL